MSQPKSKLSRRALFMGAGTAGAVAAATTVLPRALPKLTAQPAAPQSTPEKGGGYQLTEHVKRYYKTTLI